MTLLCYFLQNPPRTRPARCQRGARRRGSGGSCECGVLVWSIDGKSSKRQKSIFAGWMKIPLASKTLVWRSLAAFLPRCFLLWVPFISCQNPSFTVLILELFIIQIENRGNHQGVNHMRLGIWHPPHGCAPTSHAELSWVEWPFLLYLISTTVHVSVRVLMHRCPSYCCCYLKLMNDG